MQPLYSAGALQHLAERLEHEWKRDRAALLRKRALIARLQRGIERAEAK